MIKDNYSYFPKDIKIKSQLHFNRYIKFINLRKLRTIPKDTYTENHHIIPRALGGLDDTLIILTGREHFISHLILWKAFGGKMVFPLNKMRNPKLKGQYYKFNNRQYEKLKQDMSTFHKGKHSVKDKNGNTFLVSVTDTRYLSGDLISCNLGRSITEGTKKKIGKQNKGRSCIRKNGIEKRVKKQYLQNYINDGWIEGRSNMKIWKLHSPSGEIFILHDSIEKFCKEKFISFHVLRHNMNRIIPKYTENRINMERRKNTTGWKLTNII